LGDGEYPTVDYPTSPVSIPTVNLHLAHLRGFLTWVRAQDVDALPL
jgi:hypothetical protein